MPNEARPKRDASSPFSLSSWITKADEESASPPPSTSATAPVAPALSAKEPMRKVVSRNWAVPSVNASRPTDLRRSSSSSRPISKRKKTTPSSASLVVVSTSETHCKPAGPSSMPAKRKPSTGLSPNRFITGWTSAVASSKTIVSRSPPCIWCAISPTLRSAFGPPEASFSAKLCTLAASEGTDIADFAKLCSRFAESKLGEVTLPDLFGGVWPMVAKGTLRVGGRVKWSCCCR